MTKTRVIFFLLTIAVVGILGYLGSLYARGYRFNPRTLKFLPSGLLVVRSDPDGAQILINGDLKTATNANLSLPPGVYDISIKKEGYFSWNKRITIQKEIVTEITAFLFRQIPSLSPLTFTSVVNPVASADSTKIAYGVPATPDNISQDKEGLWVIETANLPLGFARDPKRITDGDIAEAGWIWSPDGREILFSIGSANYLLETGVYTPQNKRVNINSKITATQATWQKEKQNQLTAQMKVLTPALREILEHKADFILFSPDETKILYKAKGDATLPDNIIPPFPGASTQKQVRTIKAGQIYVYDIKEDRNFFISQAEDNPDCDLNTPALVITCSSTLTWFPSSKNLVLTADGKISILDYDGTNKQEVYAGSFIGENAFPTLSTDRLIILTNLGADSTPPNLYSLMLK